MKGKMLTIATFAGAAMVAIATNGHAAQGAITQFDRVDFDTSFPGTVLEDWDIFTSGDIIFDGSEINGITYNLSSGNAFVTSTFLPTTFPNGLGNDISGFFGSSDGITFSFAKPLTAFGIDINTFGDGGSVIATIDTGETVNSLFDPFPAFSTGEFLGFSTDMPFSAVAISGIGSFSYTLDTLRGVEAAVPVPEYQPGLITLGIVMGIAALSKCKQDAEP